MFIATASAARPVIPERPVTAKRIQREAGGKRERASGKTSAQAAGATAASTAPALGADLDLTRGSAKDHAARLARVARDGAIAVRLALDWNRVEPEPGRFIWAADDAAVDAARAQGLEVTLVLGPVAVWAVDPALGVPPDQARFSVPKSGQLWERYVREAARHFRGRVSCWQVREQPNVRNFRGSAQEYLQLLVAASRALRAVDLSARVILPEPVPLDPAGLDRRLTPETSRHWDIWGCYFPSRQDLSANALALSVIATEALPPSASAGKSIWVVGAEPDIPAELWLQNYLLAAAEGVGRVYAPETLFSRERLLPLSRMRYLGFLQLGPSVWALAFTDPEGTVVAAWSPVEMRLPASALSPISDAARVGQSCCFGGAPGSAVDSSSGSEPIVMLGPRPVLLRGLDPGPRLHPGPPRRSEVLAGRATPALASLDAVSADYGRVDCPEQGLYNRVLRALPGGAVREEWRSGRRCLGTDMRPGPQEANRDHPWMYFDVDDSWLYFGRGRTRVAITVECEASSLGAEKIGFNLHYDSTRGYRSTPWQWVAAGVGWQRYRIVLDDASFTNRGGYDFRISATGSKGDLWVASVTVEKLPLAVPAKGP